MASGVKVNDTCKSMYQEVKMTKQGCKKRRYCILKMNENNTEIIVDNDMTDDSDIPFQELVGKLPSDDGRYVVYDYPFCSSVGQSSKVILVMWCPGGIAVKKRMLYASSKDAIKKAFSDAGISDFHAECCDDLCEGDILAKVRKF